MKYLIILFISSLFASCQNEPKNYAPIWVEDLSASDSLKLRNELLLELKAESYGWMDSVSVEVQSCHLIEYQPRFSIKINLLRQVMANHDIINYLDTLPIMISDYYLSNLHLSNREKSAIISNPGHPHFQFPFYYHYSKLKLEIERLEHEKKLTQAKKGDSEDVIEFYMDEITRNKEKINAMNVLGIDTLGILHRHPILIHSQISKGPSIVLPKVIEGMYLVRDQLCQDYCGMRYLDLYLHAKNAPNQIWKKRFDAISYIQPMAIIDGLYLDEKNRQITGYYPDYQDPIEVNDPPKESEIRLK